MTTTSFTPPKVARNRLLEKDYDGLVWQHREYVELSASGVTFVNCDFSFSNFDRAYFKNAKFRSCIFKGCKFFNSNFRSATFYLCDFSYSTFHSTIIDVDALLPSAPKEPNIRAELLQNLRANCQETGDFSAQKAIVLAEIAASKEHWSAAMRWKDGYYREKYPTIAARLGAALRLFSLHMSGWIWGHGEHPMRLALSCALILTAIAGINFWAVLPRVTWQDSGAGLRIFEYVVRLFLDLGISDKYRGFYIMDYVIVSIRYLYIGLLISVLYKNISHR